MPSVFFLVFGSSGAGKTVALAELRGRIPALAARILSVDVAKSGDRAWGVLEVHPEPWQVLEGCQCHLEGGCWFADSLGTR
jgi:hypothetical protein